MNAKRCTKCGTDKPLEDYYRNHTRPDGRAGVCRACRQTGPSPFSRLVKPCVNCKGPIPAERSRGAVKYTTCSRECLLLSVGLPVDFDPARFSIGPNSPGPHTLPEAAEAEIRVLCRDVLGAAVLHVRGGRR